MGAGTTGPDGGTEALALDAVLGTLLAVLLLLAVKAAAEQLRRRRAGVAVLVVGAGPVGLTAALVAVRTGRVLKLTVQDARARGPLLGRPQQIALDPRSVRFLRPLGVDFDNVEGCWRNGHFFTRVGVFQEHLLSLLERKGQRPGFRLLLGTKVRQGLGKYIASDLASLPPTPADHRGLATTDGHDCLVSLPCNGKASYQTSFLRESKQLSSSSVKCG